MPETDEYYRSLFHLNPIPMWIFDTETLAFLLVNDAAIRHYGYSREEFLRMTVKDVRPIEDVPLLLKQVSEIPEDLSHQGIWKHMRKDGSFIETEVVSQEIQFGSRRARLSVLHDVTEQKKAEQALRQSEEKWRSLVQNAPNIIMIIDRDAKIRFINRVVAGFDASAVVGSDAYQYVPEPERERLRGIFEHVFENGTPTTYEIAGPGANGKTSWYKVNVAPIREERKIINLILVATDISEDKRIEETLRETRERFVLVSRATNDAVWDWDLVTNEVWWNEGVLSLFGYKAYQVAPTPDWWYEHVHPDDLERIKHSIESAIASNTEFWSSEYRFRRADGAYAFIFDRGYVIRKDSKPVRMLGAMMDITERKRAETLNSALLRIAQEAAEAEDIQEFYRSMHEIVGEFMNAKNFYIGLYDENTDSISFPYFVDEMDPCINPALAKQGLTGYILRSGQPLLLTGDKFNESVARGEFELVGAPSLDWLGVPLKTVDKTFGALVVQSYTEGVRYTEKDKEVLIFVSQHVATALLRKTSEEALRKSEEKYRSLFEESKDAVYISSADGKFLDINQAGLDLFGYSSKEEMKELDIIRDLYFDPEERSRFHAAIEEQGYVKDYELILKKKNGERMFVLETTSAVRDEEGKLVAYRGIIRDVTQLKELEEELRQAQKMEAVGRLAGGVAHDFNNTLMAITGYCELLQLKIHPSDPRIRDVLEILKAAERGAALTRQLLAFSRKQVLEPKILDLNQVLANMESMLMRLIGEDIELRLRFDSNPGRVKADPGQIEQVIMNLAVNARDAMPKGGTLIIETSNVQMEQRYFEQPPGEYIILFVTDTGAGMDQQTLSHIFEPFFTTKEKGKGTGLGLATVYGIVKQSGGYIWASSEAGKGTHFRICFPRIEQQAESLSSKQLPSVSPARGETILLVDDDEPVRSAIAVLLEMDGYRVFQAAHAQEALSINREQKGRINLLITDIIMPLMNGRELAELLQAENKKMKVLFMSGYDDQAVAQGTGESARTAFLSKPASREALLYKIRQLI